MFGGLRSFASVRALFFFIVACIFLSLATLYFGINLNVTNSGPPSLTFEVLPNVHPWSLENDILARRAATFIREGDTVADVGCGFGLFGFYALHIGKARRVIMIDSSSDAVENARLNAQRLGFEDRVEILQGDMLEPLPANAVLDVIIANLPQTPFKSSFRADKYGGVDGTEHFRRFFPQAAARLKHRGRVLFLLTGLASPHVVQKLAFKHLGAAPVAVFQQQRLYARAEYARLHQELPDYLEQLRAEGRIQMQWIRRNSDRFIAFPVWLMSVSS